MKKAGQWFRCSLVVAVGMMVAEAACVINPQPEPPGDDSTLDGTSGQGGADSGVAGSGGVPGTGGTERDATPNPPDAGGEGGQSTCDGGEYACGNGDCCPCEGDADAGCDASCDAQCDASCDAACVDADCPDAERDAAPDHVVD
jgi:hypothetical protein